MKPNDNGYMTVTLSDNGKQKKRLVHKLVLEAFVGPCPEGMQTRHLKNDKLNNRLDNLKWGTLQEQVEDRKKHGSTPKGNKHHRSKLTEKEVRRFLIYCKKFMKKNDVGIWALDGIIIKKNWVDIHDEVFIPNADN